jgi:hypothetical protein
MIDVGAAPGNAARGGGANSFMVCNMVDDKEPLMMTKKLLTLKNSLF